MDETNEVKAFDWFSLLIGILFGLFIAIAVIILFGPCGDGSTLMLD